MKDKQRSGALKKFEDEELADPHREQIVLSSGILKEKRQEYAKRHDKIIFQHDNARPHIAKSVTEALELLGWDVLPYPPYSPDLASSDYHLFRSMPHSLPEQHSTAYEDTQNWLDKWIAPKEKQFFYNGIHLWPEKSQNVIANDGKYFK